ncbi:MAG: LuxR C-terminal-related transcriptional regulator [Pseudomonadota bacterium]
MSYSDKFNQNNELNRLHLTDDQFDEVSQLHHRERLNVSIVLGLVLLFGVQDFFEDLGQGGDWMMIATDLLYASIMIGLLVYIWRHVPLARKRYSRFLAQVAHRRKEDADNWRAQAAELLSGLGRLIAAQFDNWMLTQAEQEVGFLLLKGLSFKQIAEVRGTSERTVRQQAAQIYLKAGVSGRAELSAFFLEDLLPSSLDERSPSEH